MTDIYTTCQLIWHKNENNLPKKDGEYLCKCVDLESTEDYFAIADFADGFWDCDGTVLAWAEIPNCYCKL